MTRKILRAAVCVAGCLTLAACTNKPAASVTPPPPTGPVSGRVTVDGSTTVLPVSKRMADEFRKGNPDAQIAVESSGTGGGFKKFCGGGVDIAGASRPIDAEEVRACEANHVDYVELPV